MELFPVGIWCQNDVVLSSMRRNHVASTITRRHFYVMCPLNGGADCENEAMLHYHSTNSYNEASTSIQF